MARMRPVRFSSTRAAPCTPAARTAQVGARRLRARVAQLHPHHVVGLELVRAPGPARGWRCGRRRGRPSRRRRARRRAPRRAASARRRATGRAVSSARCQAGFGRSTLGRPVGRLLGGGRGPALGLRPGLASRAGAARPSDLDSPPTRRGTPSGEASAAGAAASSLRTRLGEVELRPLVALAPGGALVGGEPLLQGGLRGGLQAGIDRGAHRVGGGGERFDAREGARLAGEVVDEVEAGIAPRPPRSASRPSGALAASPSCASVMTPSSFMRGQHVGAALARPVGVLVGAVEVRALGHAGEQRRLRHGELAHRFAEIAARRHLDAVGAAAEIDAVEVELRGSAACPGCAPGGRPRSSRGSCARR